MSDEKKSDDEARPKRTVEDVLQRADELGPLPSTIMAARTIAPRDADWTEADAALARLINALPRRAPKSFSALEAEKAAALARLAAAEAERDSLRAEVERLRGLRPEMGPFPPGGQGVPRYGIRWNGPGTPIAVPMDDGYWTPWHLAHAALVDLAAKIDREHSESPNDALNNCISHLYEIGCPELAARVEALQDGLTATDAGRERDAETVSQLAAVLGYNAEAPPSLDHLLDEVRQLRAESGVVAATLADDEHVRAVLGGRLIEIDRRAAREEALRDAGNAAAAKNLDNEA